MFDIDKIFGIFSHILFNNLSNFVVIRGHLVIQSMFAVDRPEFINFGEFFEDETSHMFFEGCQLVVKLTVEFVFHSDDQFIKESTEVDLTQQLF